MQATATAATAAAVAAATVLPPRLPLPTLLPTSRAAWIHLSEMPASIYDFDLPDRHDFEAMGLSIMNRAHSRASRKTRMRRFVAWFGAEPKYLAITWRELAKTGWLRFAGRAPKPEHLLWSFLWLNCYAVEEIHAAQVGVDEKTFREKVWFYVEGIAQLDRNLVS